MVKTDSKRTTWHSQCNRRAAEMKQQGDLTKNKKNISSSNTTTYTRTSSHQMHFQKEPVTGTGRTDTPTFRMTTSGYKRYQAVATGDHLACSLPQPLMQCASNSMHYTKTSNDPTRKRRRRQPEKGHRYGATPWTFLNGSIKLMEKFLNGKKLFGTSRSHITPGLGAVWRAGCRRGRGGGATPGPGTCPSAPRQSGRTSHRASRSPPGATSARMISLLHKTTG